MLKSKKGVELTINTMIIIVITLLVLMVMVFLIMKGTGNWTKGTTCQNQNGICHPLKSPCPEDHPVSAAYSCTDANTRCCVIIGGLG
jgi:hypothetical protein